MGATPELAALVDQPFELLREMERRSRAAVAGKGAGEIPEEWVGVGFRIGQENFVADRNQVREVLMLPEVITRVPGAKRWLLGIANLRGHLLPLIDLKMFLGGGRTTHRRITRVIYVNHRDIPAGLVVDEVQGFRRFTDGELIDHWPQTEVRAERYIGDAYQRGEDIWPVFNFYELLQSNAFLQASAE
jgi:twitching motility protein PilI